MLNVQDKLFLFFICFFLVIGFLCGKSFAQETIVNEWTTTTPTYTIKGDGINYNDGTWKKSNKAVVDNTTTYDVTTAPIAWSLNKGSGDITYTRDGLSTTFSFGGVYYFEQETSQFSAVDPSADTSNISIDGDTITYTSIYPNVNAIITSGVSGPSVSYVISSIAGWATHSYTQTVYLAFWHELKSTGHAIHTDSGEWDGTTAEFSTLIKFKGSTKDFDIYESQAVDANGDSEVVRNVLFEGGGSKDHLAQAVSDAWFSTAVLPVTVQ